MPCSANYLALRAAFGELLKPPPELSLAEWSEEHIQLPQGQSARPGRLRHWPYMREILQVMGDKTTERVTLMKSARLGFSKSIMFATGAYAATDPCPIILLVPTDDDARRFAVEEVEPIFESSPALSKLLRKGRNDGRNTLLRKTMAGGGSIKILSARAPRKLRAHDAKVLLVDEADGMEITAEGDPIALAIERTFAHADRKIIIGSTPVDEGISVVERSYGESDQRIFEVPCPRCGVFFEIQWENIRWPQDETGYRPDLAYCECPACKERIENREKPAMVHKGQWRATRPEVIGHAGFRIGALVSLLPNADWPKLAEKWLAAKRSGPAEMQVFVNLMLGRPWRTTIRRVDAETLREKAEPIGLSRLPAEVLLLTCGGDVQDDRIEAVVIGWSLEGAPTALAHLVFEGNTLEDAVWAKFDAWLKSKWRHPNGWLLGVDACAVDSGGREGRTQKVYDWTTPRIGRGIYPIKGVSGPKQVWKRAEKVLGAKGSEIPLFNIAVDVVKTQVLDALATDAFDEQGERVKHGMRFSDDLPDEYFAQVTNEVRKIKYERNRPKIVFEVKREGLPVEAFDGTVYAYAVKNAAVMRAINLRERAERREEAQAKPKKRSIGAMAAALNG
jgi:phage terminase large subunit GpA-like protein